MKHLLLIIILIVFISVRSQLKSGFEPKESLDLVRICNSFTYIETGQKERDILPKGYTKFYTSSVYGMDNRFQVYTTKNKTAVINLRGSTNKKISWMENFYSAMIPSQGIIKIEGKEFDYHFSSDTAAHVHTGFALGVTFLIEDIIYEINELNNQGVYDFYITGHSQGGALSQLLTCQLTYFSEQNIISRKNNFKTYSFAAPMVGNKAFVDDYDKRFCNQELSFLILNPADIVPKLPLSYRDERLITEKEVMALFDKEQSVNFKEIALNGLASVFEKRIMKTSKWLNKQVGGQIENKLGDIELPEKTSDINYKKVGNIIYIQPIEYPIHLKDSSILKDKERLKYYERDENGDFTDKKLYEKGNQFYQHKPFNYYVGILQLYYPKQYRKIDLKEHL